MTIFYSSGKKLFTMDKTDLAVYHENGKEVFSNSAEGIKINGEPAKKSLLDMFSKEKFSKNCSLSFNFWYYSSWIQEWKTIYSAKRYNCCYVLSKWKNFIGAFT